MNEREAVAAFKKFAEELPSTAYLSAGFNLSWGSELVDGTIYPDGITKSSNSIRTKAESFEQLIAAMRCAWDEYKTTHLQGVIRKMAIRIISITADTGECTAASLRLSDDFSDEQIEIYGNAAIEEANRLASNGPFTIIHSVANAA